MGNMLKNILLLILLPFFSQAAYVNQIQVTNFPAVQAVSQSTNPWTVSGTINLGSLGGAATESTLSDLNSKIPNGLLVTSNRLLVDGSGVTQPISATSLPLPTGAATSANQSTGNSYLLSVDTKLPSGLTVTSNKLLVDGSGVTQPISATSLPLPTGAATSANQVTSNASLASIDSKLTSPITVKDLNWTNHYANGAATATIKSGSGVLRSACYTSRSDGSTLTIYDNTAASGTIMALLAPANGTGILCLDFGGVTISTGITIVTTGSANWQLSYR